VRGLLGGLRVAANLNRAAVALGAAAAELPESVLEHARGDFAEGSDAVGAIARVVDEECAKAPFRLLLAVAKVGHGGFAVVSDGIANDREVLATLRSEVPD
jgi:hypothetical protein